MQQQVTVLIWEAYFARLNGLVLAPIANGFRGRVRTFQKDKPIISRLYKIIFNEEHRFVKLNGADYKYWDVEAAKLRIEEGRNSKGKSRKFYSRFKIRLHFYPVKPNSRFAQTPIIMSGIRSHLEEVFSFDIVVEPSTQVHNVLGYACRRYQL